MELASKAVGFLIFICVSIFTDYSWWVMILDPFIHWYFHPHILIPVFAGVALLGFLCMFVGYVMLKSKEKKVAWLKS